MTLVVECENDQVRGGRPTSPASTDCASSELLCCPSRTPGTPFCAHPTRACEVKASDLTRRVTSWKTQDGRLQPPPAYDALSLLSRNLVANKLPCVFQKPSDAHTSSTAVVEQLATTNGLHSASAVEPAASAPLPPIVDAGPAHDTMQAMTSAAPVDSYDADQFAQTVETDDLFADDFEPLAEPTIERPPEPEPAKQQTPTTPRRGRGGAGRGLRHKASSAALRANATEDTAPPNAPTGPQAQQAGHAKGTPAVRGDRSLTGGVARTKLTEEELAAKIEAMKIKNTALEEAHARAAADEASFRAGEAKAREKARKERQERQVMMSEREKNRERKLKSIKSRDWDAAKPEQEEPRGGGSRRGAYGGVVGGAAKGRGVEGWLADQAHQTDYEDVGDGLVESGVGESPARGGRGGRGRGRGGRGRGGSERGGASKAGAVEVQQPPKANDFPALPANDAAKGTTEAVQAEKAAPEAPKLQTKHIKGPSWADQMDTP